MTHAKLFTLTAAALLTANLLTAQVTQFLRVAVVDNSNVTVQQYVPLTFAFSLIGSDQLDPNDIGNRASLGDIGDDVYPFSLSTNNDVFTSYDARPDLIGYKRIPFGFASKFPATIKILTSSFGSCMDSTGRPTYAWIEQISTGLAYPLIGDTVKLDIPANITFSCDYYLHTGIPIVTSVSDESCYHTYDGEVYFSNPNCNQWKLKIYRNNIMYFTTIINQPDTLITNLTSGNYTFVSSVNSITVDSTLYNMISAQQIIPDFTVGNYNPNAGDSVTFTNITASPYIGAYTYAWTFGDGNTDTQASPTNQYLTAGNYEVILVVTDVNGCSADVFDSVFVGATVPPTPIHSFNSGNFHPSLNPGNPVSINNADSLLDLRFDFPYTTYATRVMLTLPNEQTVTVTFMSITGEIISTTQTSENQLELIAPKAGLYIIKIDNAKGEVKSKAIMVTDF